MKKILTVITALAGLGMATPVYSAPAGVSWDLTYFADSDQQTPASSSTPGVSFFEDAFGSTPNITRTPYEENAQTPAGSGIHNVICATCRYNSVEGGGGYATYNVAGTPNSIFSMMWGSPDPEVDRNRLEFFEGADGTGASVLILQGADALAGLLSLLPASAGYENGRGFVHLFVTGYTFASVVLSDASSNAFEHVFKSANQIVEEPVPLPAGLMLLLTGLAGIGYMGRSRAKRA